jgi:DNA-binding MarR family transcriptional regulator
MHSFHNETIAECNQFAEFEVRQAMTNGDSLQLKLQASLLYRFSVIGNRAATKLYNFYNRKYGMSVPAWRVLAHLGELQPVCPKEIARRAAMDSVGVTRMLNQLDELGLIEREVDGEDRRRVVLRLSKKGRDVYRTVAPLAVEAEQELTACLSASERKTLYELTRKLWEAGEGADARHGSMRGRASRKTAGG